MKITKSKLKQIIKEAIASVTPDEPGHTGGVRRSEHGRVLKYGEEPSELATLVHNQQQDYKDLAETELELLEKIKNYIENYQNVGGTPERSDYAGLSKNQKSILDILTKLAGDEIPWRLKSIAKKMGESSENEE